MVISAPFAGPGLVPNLRGAVLRKLEMLPDFYCKKARLSLMMEMFLCIPPFYLIGTQSRRQTGAFFSGGGRNLPCRVSTAADLTQLPNYLCLRFGWGIYLSSGWPITVASNQVGNLAEHYLGI